MPPGITPRGHGVAPDRHIWSGCVVDDDGEGAAIYTMEGIDIWVARSGDDNLATFTKHDGNPVVKGPPPESTYREEMRDPWVWKEDDRWHMIIGCGRQHRKGCAVPLYRSSDLINWEYLHSLYDGDT